ncbi:nuclear transport factor 2 family protein [Streptomyces sp. NPDC020755]|uniref:nuclear transport factor 2 family protein n=1 Tax=unclassified Streptomyces TaxID=2593676 RepID=UPI0022418F7E|nr:nuclear transport factor 2 family protein [Streptomyces sp. VB1]UZI28588.1 nuclear transport factor 2 family protein [Streptomyces sp. VB1]
MNAFAADDRRADGPADPGIHLQVQQFYARQMQLLDDGKAEEWARTFTDDGVFQVGGEAVRGASDIARAARQTVDRFDADGITRRHWLGMLTVDGKEDEVGARSYAVVLETPRGGDPVLRRSTVCADLLVREAGEWRVRHRTVTRDGLD